LLEGDEFVASIREGLINPAAYLNAHKLVAFVTLYTERVIIFVLEHQALRNVVFANFGKEMTWLHDVLCEYCN